MFIVYGSLGTGASVNALLLSGLAAVILLLLFQMATVYVVVRRMDMLAKRRFAGWATVGRTGLAALPVLLIPFIILGGIFSGVFTPTESASVAALVGDRAGALLVRRHVARARCRACWCWRASRPAS